jgi:hypothetical protein
MNSAFDQVVEILKSDSHVLRDLVALTGRDRFRFFNGADLTGLDLSEQDLTGMNFDNADLRFSNLRLATHDPGCFNNSILDNDQHWLRDDFEFNATEIIQFPNEQLQAFVKMRPSIIDTIIGALGVKFDMFASRAELSLASLRKARQGKIVAVETAQSVLEASHLLLRESGNDLYRKVRIPDRATLRELTCWRQQCSVQTAYPRRASSSTFNSKTAFA